MRGRIQQFFRKLLGFEFDISKFSDIGLTRNQDGTLNFRLKSERAILDFLFSEEFALKLAAGIYKLYGKEIT